MEAALAVWVASVAEPLAVRLRPEVTPLAVRLPASSVLVRSTPAVDPDHGAASFHRHGEIDFIQRRTGNAFTDV